MLLNTIVLLVLQAVLVRSYPFKSSSGDKANEYLVTDLPGLKENIAEDDIPKMFAGQLELYSSNNTNYFFWKYVDQKKLPENKKRTMFWLNGGPGCSSMDGALMELGPFRVNNDLKVTANDGSWHKLTDLVFVDQPVGTGYSFGDSYNHELFEVAFDFMKFLEKYFELFPEDVDNDIYIGGESYAGQYIPYAANEILKRNKSLKEGQKKYKLKALLIGNGWISPNQQSLSYMPFALQAEMIKTDNPSFSHILKKHEECQKIVNKIDKLFDEDQVHDFEVSSSVCESVMTEILRATVDYSSGVDQECYNMYDYTLKDKYPDCGSNWPYDLKTVTPFLRKEEVMKNLNLKHFKTWHECSGRVGGALGAKNSIPSIHLLPEILEEIPIILFNGNRDIICNYLGTESMIKKLKWNGETGFSSEVDQIEWVHDKEEAGYIKSERNLTFINVFDSSHMVPFDKPEVSRALIDLMTGNYDVEKVSEGKNDKRKFITFPAGVRDKSISEAMSNDQNKPEASASLGENISPTISTPSTVSSSTAQADTLTTSAGSEESASASKETTDKSHTNGSIGRLIQFSVVVVLIWGVYVLYSSYKSRPSSIIKTGPSSGKKKNVQWADQLRQFRDQGETKSSNKGFLSKTLSKLKGSEGRNVYAPIPEDIELGEHIPSDHSFSPEDFEIESEEEEETQESHNSDSADGEETHTSADAKESRH